MLGLGDLTRPSLQCLPEPRVLPLKPPGQQPREGAHSAGNSRESRGPPGRVVISWPWLRTHQFVRSAPHTQAHTTPQTRQHCTAHHTHTITWLGTDPGMGPETSRRRTALEDKSNASAPPPCSSWPCSATVSLRLSLRAVVWSARAQSIDLQRAHLHVCQVTHLYLILVKSAQTLFTGLSVRSK